VDLTRFVKVLRRSWLLVVLAVLACIGIGTLVVSRQTPSYTARMQLFVATPSTPDNLSSTYQGGLFAQQRVLSYSHIVSSPAVLTHVIAALRLPLSIEQLQREIRASVPINTVLIDVAVSDHSATRAARIANEIGVQFPGLVQSLETAPGRQAPVRVSVTSPAAVPPSPSSPRKKVDLAIAAFIGLVLGVGISALRWFFDTRMRTASDASSLAGTAVVGSIPVHGKRFRRRPLVAADVGAAAGEPYRRLRTNLRVRGAHGGRKAFVVSSALPEDGKTLIVANLGIAFAQAGYRVALIDADLRKPGLADIFGLARAPGLTDVLTGDMPLSTVMQRWQDGTSLSLLASGPLPKNPTELLDSQGFASVLDELEYEYDLVIIDSPALLPVSDAAVIAQLTTHVLLVARLDVTRADQFDAAVAHLRAVNAQILGIVLNRSHSNTTTSYGSQNDRSRVVERFAPSSPDPSRPVA
jgi:polysaccharide biosynthesis transport protein